MVSTRRGEGGTGPWLFVALENGVHVFDVRTAEPVGQSPRESRKEFHMEWKPREGIWFAVYILCIGGLRNMDGCLPAALLVGLVNAFGAVYLPQYYNVLPAALMVICMFINPRGIFTKREGR